MLNKTYKSIHLYLYFDLESVLTTLWRLEFVIKMEDQVSFWENVKTMHSLKQWLAYIIILAFIYNIPKSNII